MTKKQLYINITILLFMLFSSAGMAFLIDKSGETAPAGAFAAITQSDDFVPLAVSDFPAGSEDMQFLKPHLVDVGLIALGEQTHGDGATQLAKSNIIKYLIEQLDYRVLLYEANWFGGYAFNELHPAACQPADFADFLYWFWVQPQTSNELLSYLCTKKNIYVGGFDFQFNIGFSTGDRFDSVISGLCESRPALKDIRGIIDSIPLLGQPIVMYQLGEEKEHILRRLQQASNSLSREGSTDLSTLAAGRLAHNLYNYLFWKWKISGADTQLQNTFRDSIMADNIIWLKENYFPDEKMIIWSANAHINYLSDELSNKKNYIRMGDYLKERFGNRYYALSFTSYEGEVTNISNLDDFRVNQSSEKGLEYFLHQQNISSAYIDFRGLRSTIGQPFSLKLYGHQNDYGNWANMTDGLFFIDRMTPLKMNAE